MEKVIKRDGRIVNFNSNKITAAIKAATLDVKCSISEELLDSLTDQVTDKLKESYDFKLNKPCVEDIQDEVERVLVSNGLYEISKSFILYREERAKKRAQRSGLMKTYKDLTFSPSKDSNLKRENGNINGETPMGKMLRYGSEGAKQFASLELLTEEANKAHNKGDIHIHDLDFYGTTTTCDQIDLSRLFEHGFSTGHGYLRTPNGIKSYSALACIAIQSNQNDQHGGQSIPLFDYYLAPGVAKTFISEICDIIETRYDLDLTENKKQLKELASNNNWHIINEERKSDIKRILDFCIDFEFCWNLALKKTDKETFQAMEAFVHNLNTMQSRAGSQVPFSSINFGTDISTEGRMVSKNLLLSTEAGLGNGETPIFPISIFKVKEGVNYNEKDPNYDLFKLAIHCSAKRLFPNFVFIDAPFNLKYYHADDPTTEAVAMGCVSGKEIIKYKIGNLNYSENFRSAWNRISNKRPVLKSGISEFVDVSDLDLYIKDSYNNGYSKVLKFIRNPDQNNWYRVSFEDGQVFMATADHPLPVYVKGRTKVEDMEVGDICFSSLNKRLRIIQLQKCRGIRELSYDVETESDRFDVSGIMSHNCRTRVLSNVYDPSNERVTRRGNLSFTSINLPRLALRAKGDLDKFYKLLNIELEIVKDQLLSRLQIQGSYKVKNFPFLMGEGNWIGSEKLNPEDSIMEILKQGTLSIGFIGLAETLTALIGKHHGESPEAQKLGLEIIGYMRNYTDKLAEEMKLNWSIIATPAEGLSGRFVKMDKKRFGNIPGVTDKEWYTNSFHIPVEFNISAFEKINLEAPYHALTNAGHISYVEMDGDPLNNLEAFENIIRHMKETGMGYGAINHPVDRDPICSYTGIINDICPKCGRLEGKGINIEELNQKGIKTTFKPDKNGNVGETYGFNRIRRITGYLVGTLDRFNDAKKSECEHRIKHL